MEFSEIQKERIYLTGFMGTGKTTVGKILSQMLGYRFIDTDSLIEKESGMTINEIFKNYDETYFRELEIKVLSSTFNLKKAIISTGGGLPVYNDSMKLINVNGISVCLTASPDIILSRLEHDDKILRPLLQGENREEKLNILMQKRVYYYIQSHIIVDTSVMNPQEVAEIISNKVGC